MFTYVLLSLMHEFLFNYADYDPAGVSSGLTPSKRSVTDCVDDMESAQLSSTKLIKDVKKRRNDVLISYVSFIVFYFIFVYFVLLVMLTYIGYFGPTTLFA